VESAILSVTGEEPTPETFITALNQSVDPLAIAVPLKFADMEESQPDVVIDIVCDDVLVDDCSGGTNALLWPLHPASAATAKAAAIRITSVDMT
jgi:hypothetical protein